MKGLSRVVFKKSRQIITIVALVLVGGFWALAEAKKAPASVGAACTTCTGADYICHSKILNQTCSLDAEAPETSCWNAMRFEASSVSSSAHYMSLRDCFPQVQHVEHKKGFLKKVKGLGSSLGRKAVFWKNFSNKPDTGIKPSQTIQTQNHWEHKYAAGQNKPLKFQGVNVFFATHPSIEQHKHTRYRAMWGDVFKKHVFDSDTRFPDIEFKLNHADFKNHKMSQNIGINWANLNTGRKARHESTALGDIVKWANKQKIQPAPALVVAVLPQQFKSCFNWQAENKQQLAQWSNLCQASSHMQLFATLKSRLDAWPKQVGLIVENPAAKPTDAYYKAAFEKAVEDFKVHLGDWRRLGAGPVGTVFKIQHGNKKIIKNSLIVQMHYAGQSYQFKPREYKIEGQKLHFKNLPTWFNANAELNVQYETRQKGNKDS